MNFNNLEDLVNKVNQNLGQDFCDSFQYKRKELLGASRSAARGRIFKFDEKKEYYTINEGGGVELQYNINFNEDENTIFYGLGFNTFYVPFNNEMLPVDYMKPYIQAFLFLKEKNSKILPHYDFWWGKENMYNPKPENHTLWGVRFFIKNNETYFEIDDTDFEKMITDLKTQFEVYVNIFEKRNEIIANQTQQSQQMQAYTNLLQSNKNLLQSNKNLILTGAPGTGKTYLAKAIAAAVTNETVAEGNESEQTTFVQFHPSYDYTDFVEGLRPIKKGDTLGFELKNGIFKAFCKKAKENSDKQFVFIIDEINRGEISKIFGELFFSIDPGYRGIQGKVKTQYSNIQTEATCFTNIENDVFYIPENVYIIGTMNDIDRSVESFDFAMRRRFAWKEVTAAESQKMLENKDFKAEAIAKMNALNEKIGTMDGLGTAFHIGAAYFLKLELEHCKNDFQQLWELHIGTLLSEYLRGMQNAKTDLDNLKKVYDDAK